MITKELIKSELDKVPNEFLEIIYKILKAFEFSSVKKENTDSQSNVTIKDNSSWDEFINSTYGTLSNSPIERGEQGQFEIRDVI